MDRIDADLLRQTVTGTGLVGTTLGEELADRGPVLLTFLRHLG